jgi:hypothetical protein
LSDRRFKAGGHHVDSVLGGRFHARR